MTGVAIIGSGAIALANHLPGFALCPDTKVVALCDASPAVLEKAKASTGIAVGSTDFREIVKRDDVSAVLIATPNVFHSPIALAAIAAGKHVMVEKPIAMNLAEARTMLHAADAAKVTHMTAFTYRFVPAMRYMVHLVKTGAIGKPYHFRAARFQDWNDRNLGWRQIKKMAGSGEMGDMLSHRIDYGRILIGEYDSLVADFRRFLDVRQGNSPSDLDDWVSMIVRFKTTTDGRPVTGNLESTKLATGRGEGHRGLDLCEVNGSEGTLAYTTQKPLELLIGKKNDPDLHPVKVPKDFLVIPGSPRDPGAGDPLATFRYDQNFEFIDAIRNRRPATPSLLDGAKAQAIMESALLSEAERRWVDVPQV